MAECSVKPTEDKKNFISSTLIIEFKGAFMTVPLHVSDQPYTCCDVPQGTTRTRTATFVGDVVSGTFVVWRVLGFGNRPSPLSLCTGGILRDEVHPVPGNDHEQHIGQIQEPSVR